MKVYMIGGREFSPIDMQSRTVRQDHFMVAVFRRTGIDRVSTISEEDPKQYLIRLHSKLLASGLACEVLSAFVLPKGMANRDWRKEVAAETQSHLEGCNTEEDRQLVNQLAFEAMTGFFKQGLLSLLNSMKRSQPNDGNPMSESSPRIEESSGTKPEIGLSPSDSSLGTISTER